MGRYLNMGLFFKKKSDPFDITSSEELVNFWIYVTKSLIDGLAEKEKERGQRIFNIPITEEGIFGLQTDFYLSILVNEYHAGNLREAKFRYPLNRTQSLTHIVDSGPLWIISTAQTCNRLKGNEKSPDIDYLEVVLYSSIVIGLLIDQMAQIADVSGPGEEKMGEAFGQAITLMGGNE